VNGCGPVWTIHAILLSLSGAVIVIYFWLKILLKGKAAVGIIGVLIGVSVYWYALTLIFPFKASSVFVPAHSDYRPGNWRRASLNYRKGTAPTC
jgi:hypothetical protein